MYDRPVGSDIIVVTCILYARFPSRVDQDDVRQPYSTNGSAYMNHRPIFRMEERRNATETICTIELDVDGHQSDALAKTSELSLVAMAMCKQDRSCIG